MSLSVVVPCFNEEESLPELHSRLTAVCESLGRPYELVLVDDGSRDRTWEIIAARAAADPHLHGVRLARNHGHQLALTAGLAAARGERVMMLDADLQDPPELLPQMMAEMDRGYDVVYGKRVRREGETAFKKTTASLFYRIINRLADVDIPVDVGDFRLVNRRVLDAFLAMPERTRFVRGMFAWLGHRQIGVDYIRQPRNFGESKYPLKHMIRFAGDALTGFSVAPLRLATWLAYASLVIAAAVGIYVLWSLIALQTVQGWASILLAVAFFSGIQLLTLGIIGEYLGRLYIESKGRPLFLVAETTAEAAGAHGDPTEPPANGPSQ
ncbi:MAG: glycosyltransferase family 2 protein [Pseudomonadota bacterium]